MVSLHRPIVVFQFAFLNVVSKENHEIPNWFVGRIYATYLDDACF